MSCFCVKAEIKKFVQSLSAVKSGHIDFKRKVIDRTVALKFRRIEKMQLCFSKVLIKSNLIIDCIIHSTFRLHQPSTFNYLLRQNVYWNNLKTIATDSVWFYEKKKVFAVCIFPWKYLVFPHCLFSELKFQFCFIIHFNILC